MKCLSPNCQHDARTGSEYCHSHVVFKRPTVVDQIIETARALDAKGQIEFTSSDIVALLPSIPRSTVTSEFSLAASMAFTRVRREGRAVVWRLR